MRRSVRNRSWQAGVAIGVFVVATQVRTLLRHIPPFLSLWRSTPELANLVVNSLQAALAFLGLWVAHRLRPRAALAELGLRAPVVPAVGFALGASLPMLVGFALTSPPSPNLSMGNVVLLALVFPFAEELLFRGYCFRQLHERAGWGFWSASLAVALVFGLGHSYQAVTGQLGLAGLLGVVAITGAGSVLFSWVFVRWSYNLWAPFALHAAMNLWWEVFAVDQTALGGWLANVARLLTVALAIGFTLMRSRRHRARRSAQPEGSVRPSDDQDVLSRVRVIGSGAVVA